MSTGFYDIPGSEDTVRLLSNPLNNENLEPEEFEFVEEIKCNESTASLCQMCCSISATGSNNVVHSYLDNDQSVPLSSDCHSCHHCHQFFQATSSSHSRTKLLLTICLCLVFMTAEMVGGFVAGSVAVVSDGAHLLTDVVGLIISLVAVSMSKKKSTKNFNLGFYRIEVLATLASILLMWIMTGVFLYVATDRLLDGNYEIEVDTMVVISSFGVLVNIAMFSVLHGSCDPRHIHSHQRPLREDSARGQNINVRAAIIHVVGDLIQSVGVFVSSVVIKFYPQAKFMDPVCTFLFSFIVVCSTLRLLKDSLRVLMEGFPTELNYKNIRKNLQNINGVRHVHNLFVWSLTLEINILGVHLAVDDTVDRDVILFQAQNIIKTKFDIPRHVIQIEKYHPKCICSCPHCKSLWT